MAVETLHRFTALEYHQMGETGVLKPNARVELLDGQIIDMSPIGSPHFAAVNRLNRLFNSAARQRWIVSVQNPVRLDDHSEPQPDLALLKPSPDDYATRPPAPEDVLLLIEVADSTLAYDRGRKLPAYGRAGIAEVWIVNLVEQTIELYREPHYTGYGSTSVLHHGDQARPQAFPDVVIQVNEVLGRG